MSTSNILIPVDFREESQMVFPHAAFWAQQLHGEITLLHVCSDEADTQALQSTLDGWKSKLAEQFQGSIQTVVRPGSFLKDWGQFTKELGATHMIMPTHGMVGDQAFQGSLALNIITESAVPCLVIQQGSAVPTLGCKAMIPMQYRAQFLEESASFASLLRATSSAVTIVTNEREKEDHLKNVGDDFNTELNKADIQTELETSQAFDFSISTMKKAAAAHIGYLIAMNFSYESLFSISPRTDEEDFIYHTSRIPVWLITPRNQDDMLDKPFADSDEAEY